MTRPPQPVIWLSASLGIALALAIVGWVLYGLKKCPDSIKCEMLHHKSEMLHFDGKEKSFATAHSIVFGSRDKTIVFDGYTIILEEIPKELTIKNVFFTRAGLQIRYGNTAGSSVITSSLGDINAKPLQVKNIDKTLRLRESGSLRFTIKNIEAKDVKLTFD